ncbi:LamG domain-containing protein [Candidatus Poribacteria bacterium]
MRVVLCILTVALCALYFGAAYAQEGLVLYFSFDDVNGDEVIDGSGNQNSGTMLGGAEIVDGRVGKAIEIDGVTGRVEVPNSDSLSIGANSLTIECWLKTTSADRHTYSRIVSKGNFSWTPGYIFQLYSQGQPAISISDQSKVAIYAAAKGAAVNDGEWHHIAGVVDRENDEARLYIDGQLQENELPLGAAAANVKDIGDITCDNNLAFGSDDQQARELVEGLYDELRIWNRVLTDVEVQQAANGKMPGAAVEPEGKLSITWAELKK